MIPKKRFSIIEKITYYNLIFYIPVSIAACLLFVMREPAFEWLSEVLDISYSDRSYELYENLLYIIVVVAAVLWFYHMYRTILTKRYKYLTGRNLPGDSSKFNKKYPELVSYFRHDRCEPHRFLTDGFEKRNWRECEGIVFGYDEDKRAVWLPENCEYNFCIFGPPGSSKTAGFCNVNAITFPGSCLIVDIKSDIYNYVISQDTGRKIIRFCPDHRDALKISAHFDPFLGIKEMSPMDRKRAIETLAYSLIPDDGGNEGNYFCDTARLFFRGIFHLLYHINPDVTFPELIHSILASDFQSWIENTANSDCEEAKEILASLEGNNEKNVSSGYQNLTKRIEVFSDPVLDELLTYKEGATISTKMLDDGYDIYLQIKEEHLIPLGGLLCNIISAFSNQFLLRADTSTGVKHRYVLMVLDELSSLHLTYDQLNVNLSKLRSKAVLSALVLQNLPQLQKLYSPVGAESIMGNCHVQAILGSNDYTTSEYFSRNLGYKHDYTVSKSIGGTTKGSSSNKTVSETEVPVFRPEDVSDLKPHNLNIVRIDGRYAFLQKLNCYKD